MIDDGRAGGASRTDEPMLEAAKMEGILVDGFFVEDGVDDGRKKVGWEALGR